MNDDIRKMLADAGNKALEQSFEKDLRIFSLYADRNTPIIYKEMYRLMIEEYMKNPILSGKNAFYYASIAVQSYSTTNYDLNNNITYSCQKTLLAEAYNKGKYNTSDRIAFYTCINGDTEINDVYFNGFHCDTSYRNCFYVSMEAEKFRNLINESRTKTR